MAWVTKISKYMLDPPALTADEKFASLFQPDTLLAAEYFQNFRRRTILQPEKKLMLAVLADAVNCFCNNVSARSERRKTLFEEAKEWILDEDRDGVFSFANICEVLEFDPEYVRQGLLRWKENRLSNDPAGKDCGKRCDGKI